MQKNLLKSTSHGVFWMGSGQIILIVVRLMVLAILARWLGPAEFGLVGMVLVILGFFELLAGMGIAQAIVQRKDLEERHIAAGLVLIVSMSLGISLLLYFASGALSRFLGREELAPVLQMTTVIFPLKALGTMPLAVLLRNLRFKALALIEIVSFTLGYGLVGIVLALLGFGVWSLVAAFAGRVILETIFAWIAMPRFRFSSMNAQTFKEILSIGPGFAVAQLGGNLSVSVDRVIVFKIFGAAATGLYDRAFTLARYPEILIAHTIDKVMFPILSDCQDDLVRMRRAYCDGCTFMFGIACAMTIPLIVAGNEIILLALGPGWEEAVPLFQVFSLILVIRFGNRLNESISRAMGAVYRRAWRVWMQLALIMAFCWFGAGFGLFYVVIGVGFALLINFLLQSNLSLSLLEMRWGDWAKLFAKPLCLYLAAISVTWYAVSSVRQSTESLALILAVSLLIPGVLYSVILWKSPHFILGSQSQRFFDLLWGIIPARLRAVSLVQSLLRQPKASGR